MSQDKKNTFYMQGIILAAASVLSRIMGLVFRMILVRIIGDEGNGIYSKAYEIYNLALLLSTYSVPLAVSKLVSAREAEKQYVNSHKVFKSGMMLSSAIGLAMALFLFFGADFLADKVYYSPNAATSLKILAPTIFVFSVMGVIRGFFQGKSSMVPTSVSQIIEQIFHVGVGLIAAWVLFVHYSETQYAYAYGAAGATVGTLAGAVAALAFMAFIYIIYTPVQKKRMLRDTTEKRESELYLAKLLLLTMLPIILNQTLYSISGMIDMYLLGNILKEKQVLSSTTDVLWSYYGKYRTITGLPTSIASAMGVAIVPNIVKAFGLKNKNEVKNKTDQAVKFNMLIAMPSAVGLFVLARPVMELIYSDYSGVTDKLMYIGAVSVIFYAYATTTNSILQGIDHLKSPAVHASVSLVICIGVDYILLKYFDMSVYGLVIGNTLFPLIICILNAALIKDELSYKHDIKRTFILPLACSIIMGAVVYAVNILVHMVIPHNLVNVVCAIAAGVVVYFILIIRFRVMAEDELLELPKGSAVVRLAKKMKLL